jgi:peptide/nickel transport system substrate-binding protein
MVLLLTLLLGALGTPSASATTTTVTLVPGKGGRVAVGLDQAPTTCNPNASPTTNWATQAVLGAVLPSAFIVNEKGMPELNQALLQQAEVISTSPQTVVYDINPRAEWSDGKPFSAEDFVYAWQQQAQGAGFTGTPDLETSRLGYADIASVKGSSSGRTVTVVFSTPYADWRMLFSDMLPAHVMNQVGWNPECTTVDPAIDLSAGPWELSEDGGGLALVHNPHWWGTKPALDRIDLRFAPDADQLAAWLRDGVVDVAAPTSFDPAYLTSVAAEPDVQGVATPATTFLQLDFSTTGTETLDPTVRLAIANAVDRQDLIDTVAGWADSSIQPSASHLYAQSQSAYPDSSVVLNTLAGTTVSAQKATTPAPFPTDADLPETVHLLTTRGYGRAPDGTWLDPTGKPLVLDVALDTGDAWAYETGIELVHQLQRAKFTVTTMTEPDAASAGNALAAGDVDMAVLPMASSAYPTQGLSWYTSALGPPGLLGSQNWTNLDDPDVNSNLQSAAEELNPVTAQPTYDQVDRDLWTSMVALPLFAEPWTMSWNAAILGVVPNAFAPTLLWDAQNWSIGVAEPAGHSGTPNVRGGPPR